jgi:hypothetical protein
MCCIVCKALASPDLQLQYCAACKSALYCSKACQKKDWKQHKQICKLLNVGHGDMQVRTPMHMNQSIALKEQSDKEERKLVDHDDMRFFKLFQESTEDGSRAAALKMRKIAELQIKIYHNLLLFLSLRLLVWSATEMLPWPNSPLLVLLQFVDPNMLTGDDDVPLQEGQTRLTPLHLLVDLSDPCHFITHKNQLILARQLIEHGANVNAVSIPHGRTPLHHACYWGNVTNLDFVELLLAEGADPNVRDQRGLTPLMLTVPLAPGAAKFLLSWPTTDANITARSGASFLAKVREAITEISNKDASPCNNTDKVVHQLLLRQWREIEGMLVERGAHDTGITAFE